MSGLGIEEQAAPAPMARKADCQAADAGSAEALQRDPPQSPNRVS